MRRQRYASGKIREAARECARLRDADARLNYICNVIDNFLCGTEGENGLLSWLSVMEASRESETEVDEKTEEKSDGNGPRGATRDGIYDSFIAANHGNTWGRRP